MTLNTLVDLFLLIPGLGRKEAFRDRLGYRTCIYNYQQIFHSVSALACYFVNKGLKKGDHILLWGENRHEWVIAFWACVVRGLIVVPVDYRFSTSYVRKIQEEIQPALLIYGQEVQEAVSEFWSLDSLSFSQIEVFENHQELVYEEVKADDIVEIIYTSGTTGNPKGVIHKHSNICANLNPLKKEFAKYRNFLIPVQPIRVLDMLPLSHMFGQALGLSIPVLLQGAAVFVNNHHPRNLIETIKEERVTALVAVPRLLNQLQKYIDQYYLYHPVSFQRMKIIQFIVNIWRFRELHSELGWKFWVIVAGGAEVKPALEDWWGERGFIIVQGYGLTEASPIVSLNHPFHVTKGSLGKVIEGNEVKIAPDGEILVRGQSISSRYTSFSNDSQVFSDGWFHTGDLGKIDQKGNLFYKGRKKDVIITSEGYNVFPADIEEVLNSFDLVRESVVVGIESQGKTRIQAVLCLENNEEEVSQIIQETNRILEPYQRIQGWFIWPEEDFPRTPSTMKIRRGEIVSWLKHCLSDQDQDTKRNVSRDKDKVVEILSQIVGCRAELIKDEYLLADDLGLSSLDALELVVQLEHDLGLSLDESQINNINTVKELKDWVNSRQGKGPDSKTEIEFDRFAYQKHEAYKSISGSQKKKQGSIPNWPHNWPVRIIRAVLVDLIILPIFRRIMNVGVKNDFVLDSLSAPVIFAANHSSHLDTLAILMALPSSWRGLIAPGAREEHFEARLYPGQTGLKDWLKAKLQYFLGSLIFNLFPLSQKLGGTRRVLQYMGQLVKKGQCPLIYPEGRFSPDGRVQSFQSGIGLMARNLQLKIIPVYISGTRQLLPPEKKWPARGSVTITFGQPLSLENEKDAGAAAKKVEEAVKEAAKGAE